MAELYYRGEWLYRDGKWNAGLLKANRWLYYICITNNRSANVERAETVGNMTGLETVEYVLRTLEILEGYRGGLDYFERTVLERALQWSEVAKGGTEKQRGKWLEQGLPLAVHNLASAEIFREEGGAGLSDLAECVVYNLVRTHGLVGQNIRGEVPVAGNLPLYELVSSGLVREKDMEMMLLVLNHCVIGAVSPRLWERVKPEVEKLVKRIMDGKLHEYGTERRLRGLCPSVREFPKEMETFFKEKVFPHYELWYFGSALSGFSAGQTLEIMKRTVNAIGNREVRNISFKPLADALYYDYEDRKKVNVYKKRVIEKLLKDGGTDDADLSVRVVNGAALVGVELSPACAKLIEFCMEAERSGLLTYEKSIVMLFDMFGFRRDGFDRLNNEERYLETMNGVDESTKASIADYVVGRKIVDVGSGGGVMLDLLEDKYPDREIIGTDISANVIEALQKKKTEGNHRWDIVRHNFVGGALPFKADTVIFSSVLHEVFSYTDTGRGKFDIGTVYTALRNAYASLNEGGRIVIRDGVKTPNPDGKTVCVKFKTREGMETFLSFCRDFKGLPDVHHDRPTRIDDAAMTAHGDINYIREFLYTYTWGAESYAHEVQEQFGYLTLDEFLAFFTGLGADVAGAREFLEPGYKEHLSPLVSLYETGTGLETEFPNSNCIIVVEKPYGR